MKIVKKSGNFIDDGGIWFVYVYEYCYRTSNIQMILIENKWEQDLSRKKFKKTNEKVKWNDEWY